MDTVLRYVESASLTIFAALSLFMLLAMTLKELISEYVGLRKLIGYLGNVDTEKRKSRGQETKDI
jgi:hypothetical protein